MRIGGITPHNKTHARELWEAKWGKRGKDPDDMDVEEDTRSKKRRKITKRTDVTEDSSLDYEIMKLDGMGLETGTMKTTMTMGTKANN